MTAFSFGSSDDSILDFGRQFCQFSVTGITVSFKL
jgi:hypothetical protein